MKAPTNILDKSLKRVLIAGVFRFQGGNISYQESDEVPYVDQAVLNYFLNRTPSNAADLIKTPLLWANASRGYDGFQKMFECKIDANPPSELPEFAWQGVQRGDDYRLIFHRRGQQPSQPKDNWIKLLNGDKWADVKGLLAHLEKSTKRPPQPTNPPLNNPPEQATSATHQIVPTSLSNDPPKQAKSATHQIVPTSLSNDPPKQAKSATVPKTSEVRPPEQATSATHQTARTLLPKDVRIPPNSPHITTKSTKQAAEPKPWYRSLLSACLGGQSKPRTRRRNGQKNGPPSVPGSRRSFRHSV